MKNYSIFIKGATKKSRIEDVILIQEGFNIYAFLFNFLWLFFKELYVLGILYCGIVTILFSFFSTFFVMCIIILMNFLIAFESENILFFRLRIKGCSFIGFMYGENENDAKLKFLDRINKENKKEETIIY